MANITGSNCDMLSLCADTIRGFPTLRASGLSHRRPTDGMEKDLVDAFVETKLAPPPEGQIRLTFVEPRLESGFPDLVVVYLHADSATNWQTQRASLGKKEICVLHHLASRGPQSYECLRELFASNVRSSLTKLQSVQMIEEKNRRFRVVAIRQIMAVRRIVAIEAKVHSWRAGIDQAFLNRVFASESYLLLPKVPNAPALDRELELSGVGLLTSDTPMNRPVKRAKKRRLPTSYASWLFNEWACHAQSAFNSIDSTYVS